MGPAIDLGQTLLNTLIRRHHVGRGDHMLFNNLVRNFFHCLLLTQMFSLNAAGICGD